MNNETAPSANESFEVTVTGPATTAAFIDFLRQNNYNGNVGINDNYPGVVWLSDNPN